MDDGPATLTAGRGVYDIDKETVRVNGPLAFQSVGYDIVASNVELVLKTKKMQSFGPVSGRTKVGTFSADRMNADLDSRVVRLDGRVRLRIDQNAIK